VLLAELSAEHVQEMFTAITRQHQAAGSPVTPATLNRIRATLRAALNAAARRGPPRPDRRQPGQPGRAAARPLAPDRLSRIFKKLAAEAGLPPVRLHDLRHGAATLALAAGVDLRTAQDQLGHSSIVLTADTYISVLPEVARTAAEKVAALILRAGCVVPGAKHRRQPHRRRVKGRRHNRPRPGQRSRAHPGRQIGRPSRRSRASPADAR
jgi:Phage integrase family